MLTEIFPAVHRYRRPACTNVDSPGKAALAMPLPVLHEGIHVRFC